MTKDWHKLTYEQQKTFKNKASYLIERGYVYEKPIDILAREIFESQAKNTGKG